MGMKRKTKKNYEAPQLTVVSFKAERGYASSGGPDPVEHTFLLGLFDSEGGDRSVESRNENGYWGNDEGTWF